MLNNKRMGRFIGETIAKKSQSYPRQNYKRGKEKLKLKKQMIKLFGKVRYYLSIWFGNWVLYTFNHTDYCEILEKPYQKFYSDEKVAVKYANILKSKYEKVWLEKVFDSHRKNIGYLLNGRKKRVALVEQPSNIIPFEDLKNLHKSK